MAVHAIDDASYEAFRQQLAAENPQVRFGRLDVDRSPTTAAREGVMGMPTFLVFRDGRKVGQVVGAVPKHTLAAAVAGH